MVLVVTVGLDRAWAGAWAIICKILESLLEIAQEHGRPGGGGSGGGGRARRGGGGGRSGNGHYHHVNGAGSRNKQRQRWKPGRRVAAAAFLTLLASYRRYQVAFVCGVGQA